MLNVKPSKYHLNHSLSKLLTVPISRVYTTSVAIFLNLHPVRDITACLLRVTYSKWVWTVLHFHDDSSNDSLFLISYSSI